jgi:hypothetical protein
MRTPEGNVKDEGLLRRRFAEEDVGGQRLGSKLRPA